MRLRIVGDLIACPGLEHEFSAVDQSVVAKGMSFSCMTPVPVIRDQTLRGRLRGCSRALGKELDFAFDLDRDVERKLGEAGGAAGVGARFGAEEVDDEIGEAVDHERLPVEAGRRVDRPQHAAPGRDAIEVAQRALEAAEDGKPRKPGRRVALLQADLASDFAKGRRRRSVGILRAVAGYVRVRSGVLRCAT